MLVDDHPIMRKGLRDVLEDSGGFEVVGQAADGVEAGEGGRGVQAGRHSHGRDDAKKDGVEACRDIVDLLPDTKVLMLTASTEEDAVIEAVAAGATGYVQKYSDSDELVTAVREVAGGRLMIPDAAVRRAFRLIRRGGQLTPGPKVLTGRECETLTLFAKGKSYEQIAEIRGIGMTTVRNAVYRIQDKLGVKTKQEIVVWAVRNGLLDEEEGIDSQQTP